MSKVLSHESSCFPVFPVFLLGSDDWSLYGIKKAVMPAVHNDVFLANRLGWGVAG